MRSAQTEKVSPPYPNPANTIVTLPYKLAQGKTSVMNIYSTSGQLIESKQIDSVFDRILLNVSGYAKGIYLYEANDVSNRFFTN
ncbi:MAG: T9SS type A sorting domain-containing protein [Prevotellaceae bacterium]|nr:T9SS type A sorting domain-containing protein [Prevotellaceae bacterium]